MVEFQYFEGCPNAKETLDNLLSLVSEGFLKHEEIKIVKITSVDDAEKLNFQGSPSILYNGIDIYTLEKPLGFAYNCRTYFINEKLTGVLTKEFIKERIQKLRNAKK
ncbi:alkylmercury lyase [Sulfurihydrogenibium sp.]|uniref:alkylmercury lyase n=1 Tax=Sulfurihydrogenibium sp. TaxID=2053621 RepID=UPI002629EA0C|nr:alkylmercury lyase [Sulfurihydrogenibium sp.]